MSKKSRDKGARFERTVAQWFCDAGFTARRGASQCRDGSDAPDVVVSLPLWVEVKTRAKVGGVIPSALEQAESATDGKTPIAVVKGDRQDPIVAMRWATFIKLIRSGLSEPRQ
tara:strand:- start:268 stop:606 length:339 start_codon:yes stop_codon:yes gene_type:complete